MSADPYIRAMFGAHAIQIPFNLIVQGDPIKHPDTASGVFQLRHPLAKQLYFGSTKCHQLILGEIVLRPHLVIESDAFAGHGIGGLYTSAFDDIDTWIREGNVLLDQGVRSEAKLRRKGGSK